MMKTGNTEHLVPFPRSMAAVKLYARLIFCYKIAENLHQG